MPTLIDQPTRIEAAGNKPKLIDEYVGRINNGESAVSIAHMHSPAGWIEPGQTPEFDEYTIVLRGVLRVESREGTIDVHAGQAIVVRRGEWVRYSTPGQDGTEYIAVCPPSRRRRSIGRRTDRVQDPVWWWIQRRRCRMRAVWTCLSLPYPDEQLAIEKAVVHLYRSAKACGILGNAELLCHFGRRLITPGVGFRET